MSHYLNPDHMSGARTRQVDRWLVANGCRDHVALEPVIIKGGVAEYTALCRRDAKSLRRVVVRGDHFPTRARRIRIRIPLAAID